MTDIEKAEVENIENASAINSKSSDVNVKLVDEAAQFYDDTIEYDDKELKHITRKVDWIIIPLIGVCYIFFYVDKTTISYASIFGINKDLNLQGSMYSWLSAIFYGGYFFFSIVNNFFLIRLPTGKFLGFNIFMWGVLLMIQAACKSFKTLMVVRFFGGAFESVADPAFMLITGMWYTRREQPIKMGIWYTFNGIGISCGGLLGFGIGQIKGGLPSWKYEFLVIGAACCFWGICIAFLMPDNPVRTRYFSTRQKKVLVHKLRSNQTGVETKIFKMYQMKEAFLDIRLYILFLVCLFHNLSNGVISNFGTLIINGLGYSRLITTVLQIPYGAIIALFILACVYLNDFFILKLKRNLRCVFIIIFLLPNIAGSFGLLFISQKHHVAKLMCYYLTGAYNASFIMVLSLSTSNIAGYTKKIIFNASIFMGYCVGNFAGPFLAKPSQASKSYPLASGGMILSLFIEILLVILFALHCKIDNRNRDKEQGITSEEQRVIKHSFDDLTDKENRDFRYVY